MSIPPLTACRTEPPPSAKPQEDVMYPSVGLLARSSTCVNTSMSSDHLSEESSATQDATTGAVRITSSRVAPTTGSSTPILPARQPVQNIQMPTEVVGAVTANIQAWHVNQAITNQLPLPVRRMTIDFALLRATLAFGHKQVTSNIQRSPPTELSNSIRPTLLSPSARGRQLRRGPSLGTRPPSAPPDPSLKSPEVQEYSGNAPNYYAHFTDYGPYGTSNVSSAYSSQQAGLSIPSSFEKDEEEPPAEPPAGSNKRKRTSEPA